MAQEPPLDRRGRRTLFWDNGPNNLNQMKSGFITHPCYLEHDTGHSHPESPRRLSAIIDQLGRTDLTSRIEMIEPPHHPDLADAISAVHPSGYYKRLQAAVPKQGHAYLDPDTPISPRSLAAAEMAVSGVLTAIDGVMEGKFRNAFCALRPPGHHAKADRAMGFCLLNNVAIGARYLRRTYQLERVLIVDWDVHHGNGTQHIFYRDPAVFYFSTHQYPFYPGTGSETERGEGEGEGTTLNAPLSEGSGDREILSRFERLMPGVFSTFRPDFILISAGFDAHRDDPLAGLMVTDEGFKEMGCIVRSLAKTYCHERVVSCLEGGYNLSALARSVAGHLSVLTKDE